MTSPYDGVLPERWHIKTEELLASHPLAKEEVVEVAHVCWDGIFDSVIAKRARIGVDIRPKPQVMGMFLHELIPLEFSSRYPGVWRRDDAAEEKDLVYVPDGSMSVEIKTSSHKTQIFGNRSYAQPRRRGKKAKSGYYIAINFEKFPRSGRRPRIVRIHFGWLDGFDWVAQKAATGQQARLPAGVYGGKLRLIYAVDV